LLQFQKSLWEHRHEEDCLKSCTLEDFEGHQRLWVNALGICWIQDRDMTSGTSSKGMTE
jgi:hypothetical protein